VNGNTCAASVDNTKSKDGSSFWELVRFALIALIIVIPFRLFVAQPFKVSGSSMVPTFQDQNYLIVDEISYRLEKPKRGDVVIFHPPGQGKGIYYIKRVIGLPGETIKINGSTVTISNAENKDGFVLDEPYVKNKSTSDNIEKTLGETDYFVMGDNRPWSSDSRAWGTLPRENIVGRAFLRLLPLKEISAFPGEYNNY
jgi:signal peptidase I